jgi:hypothetical protein
MTLLLAALLLGPGDLPVGVADEPAFSDESVFLRVRGGAWICKDFKFEAVRTDSVQVESKEETLPSGAIEFGVFLPEGLYLAATAEASIGSHTHAGIAGLSIGYRERRAPDASALLPDEGTAYLGGFYGRFEVDAEGFGDFDDAFGFRGGLSASWKLSSKVLASIAAEYRYVEFEYEGDVLAGDTHAGGSGVWIGASIDFRF